MGYFLRPRPLSKRSLIYSSLLKYGVLLAPSGCTQVIAADPWITVLSSLVFGYCMCDKGLRYGSDKQKKNRYVRSRYLKHRSFRSVPAEANTGIPGDGGGQKHIRQNELSKNSIRYPTLVVKPTQPLSPFRYRPESMRLSGAYSA